MVFFLTKEYLSTQPQLDVSFLDKIDPINPNRIYDTHHLGTIAKVRNEWSAIKTAWKETSFFPSIVGRKDTFLKNPSHPHSEWGAILTWRKNKKVKKLIAMWACSLGSVFFPPLGLLLKVGAHRRMNEIRIVHQHYGQGAERSTELMDPEANLYHANSQEILMFINGVSTNRDLQWENGLHLADIFKRDIYLIHNPTEGMLFDLAECEMGRTFRIMMRVARVCANLMLEQLRSNPDKKVIILAHSQGTIIISDAIKYIIKENNGEGLDRLEVYTFGCASSLFYQVLDKRNNTLVPFYEHFANTKDFVARTGVLRNRSYIREHSDYFPFPGDIFECDKEGHLLGEHYLPELLNGEFRCKLFPEKTPKLQTYIPTYEIYTPDYC